MADTDLEAPLSSNDVVSGFQLAFGRDPESDETIRDKQRFSRIELLKVLFTSSEFLHKTYHQVMQSQPISGGLFDAPPTEALSDWAADFCPLSPISRESVRASRTWYALFFNLFSDRLLTGAVLELGDPLTSDAFLSALGVGHAGNQAGAIEGRVETIGAHEVRGWAVDTRDPDRVLEIELRLDGVFAAAGATQVFRRELQELYGGGGHRGFVIRRRPQDAPEGRPVRAEVREAASGSVIGVFELPARQRPPLDEVAAIRRELTDLRALISRIEDRLPGFNAAFGFSLTAYEDYFRTYYGPFLTSEPAGRSSADLCVVIDASTAELSALDAAMESVARQTASPAELTVVHAGGQRALEIEAVLAPWRQRLEPATKIAAIPVEGVGWTGAMNTTLESATTPYLLLTTATLRLSPRAVEAFAKALEAGAALVYSDEDTLNDPAGLAEAGHRDPSLRTDFDHDLLLQQDALGGLIGLNRERVRDSGGFRADYEPAGLYDLALRLSESAAPGAIGHVPEVLGFQSPSLQPGDAERARFERRMASLKDHLARTDPEAVVELHSDVLGAPAPQTTRVRRPARLAEATAAIIVPTKDRLDLLGPCIASLLAAQPRNRIRTEIIVVDNQSTAATTRAFLESFSALTQVRVVEHDGAFNWALINNRAAAATQADVLVFLNNDTVVLSPDWCDELCEHALRPEVGAVGARLLYEDGTIQHAGVVIGGVHSFAAHEGVGAPGCDPGYLGRHTLVRQVSAVTGACLATRASVFHDLGGFDAINYPIEANDVDYCLRLRARGLAVVYNPYATLYHFESKSRGFAVDQEKKAEAARTASKLRARWSEPFGVDPFYNPHFERLGPPLARLRPPPFLSKL